MHLLPKTKIGKIALCLGIAGLFIIILLNVIAEKSFCGICPEGYRLDRGACNPECYYSVPQCLAPSTQPVCNMDIVESKAWRIFDVIVGLLAMAGILASGIISFVSIIKYRERAILIFIPVVLGIMGLIFILGEIFIPH